MAIDALTMAAKKKSAFNAGPAPSSQQLAWNPVQPIRDPGYGLTPVATTAVNLPASGVNVFPVNDWGTGSSSSTPGSSASGGSLDPYSDPQYLALVSQIEAARQASNAGFTQQEGMLDTTLAQRMAELRRQYQKARGQTTSNSRVRGTRNSSQYQNLIADLSTEENRTLAQSEQEIAAQKAAIAQLRQQQESEFGFTKAQAAMSAAERLQAKRDAMELQREQNEMMDEIRRANEAALAQIVAEMNAQRGVPRDTEPASPTPPTYMPSEVQDRLTQLAFLKAVASANPQAAYMNAMRIQSELAGMGYDINGNRV